jgi:2-haloacid dehalogenase
MAKVRAVIFDAYGTVLDVHAAMRGHAKRLGPDWERMSQDWRNKQLEYTWVRSLAGPAHHRDFFTLTREALLHVAARHRIEDAALLDELLAAYRKASTYQEVPMMLDELRARKIARAILSNGEPRMLADAMAAAGIAPLLDAVLSVEAVGVFKPDPRVYGLVAERFNFSPTDMAFVSSNAWDAFGALENGFRVFWVNRAGQPDEYNLRARVVELSDLAGLAALVS